MSRHFWGKYSGKVEKNVDPEGRGRIQVSASAVLGKGNVVWALPCVPYAGKGVGFWAIPPEGANVWVEFKGGNLKYPIWSGCFWEEGELMPATLASMKVLQTDSARLEFNDLEGNESITLTFRPSGPKPLILKFSASGIELNNQPAAVTLGDAGVTLTSGMPTGKIEIGANVNINGGALEIT